MFNLNLYVQHTGTRSETLKQALQCFQSKEFQKQERINDVAREFFRKVHNILKDVLEDPEFKFKDTVAAKRIAMSPRRQGTKREALTSTDSAIEQFLLGHKGKVEKDIKIICKELEELEKPLHEYDSDQIEVIIKLALVDSAIKSFRISKTDEEMIKQYGYTYLPSRSTGHSNEREKLAHADSDEAFKKFQAISSVIEGKIKHLIEGAFNLQRSLMRQCCKSNQMKIDDFVIGQVLPIAFKRYEELHKSPSKSQAKDSDDEDLDSYIREIAYPQAFKRVQEVVAETEVKIKEIEEEIEELKLSREEKKAETSEEAVKEVEDTSKEIEKLEKQRNDLEASISPDALRALGKKLVQEMVADKTKEISRETSKSFSISHSASKSSKSHAKLVYKKEPSHSTADVEVSTISMKSSSSGSISKSDVEVSKGEVVEISFV